MPELPEVETIARVISKHFRQQKILQVQVTDGRLREPVTADYAVQLTGGILQDVFRWGKYLFFHLEKAAVKEVMFHLGMSGRIIISKNIEPHEKIRIEFEKGRLVFVDPRRFGFTRTGFDLLSELPLGPDALRISENQLRQALKGKGEIKEVLMRQNRIAGIGNIYANEILFTAGIHPQKKITDLSDFNILKLRQAIVHVLREAIRLKGSSISDFYYGNSKQGGYQNRFRVYDREGMPCRRCGSNIEKIRQHGRSTWFCPRCQII